jgi:broad specificity phosphatase PhoE
MEILFIRHGESTENIAMKNNKEYDTNNIVLTNKGIAQAKATAKYIKKVFGKIDCIYHSPVYRCQQTAEIIAKNVNYIKELVPNELLMEYGYTSLFDNMAFTIKQKNIKKIDKRFNKILKDMNPFTKLNNISSTQEDLEKKYNFKPDTNDVIVNYTKFFEDINKNNKRILVIGHGGTTNIMLTRILNMNQFNSIAFREIGVKVTNCSITSVLYNNDKFELVQFPNDKHLTKINEKYD